VAAIIWPKTGYSSIHHAPIIVHGFKVRQITRYPISAYRLFKTLGDGSAQTIPFQIDELNEWGDYVLDQGSPVTKNDGNGLYDLKMN